MPRLAIVCVLAAFALCACDPVADGGAAADGGMATDVELSGDIEPDAAPTDAAPTDAAPTDDVGPQPDAGPIPLRPWCDVAHPAAPDGLDPALQWSRVHELVRFFAPYGAPFLIDDALVLALGDDDPIARYAAELPVVCAVGQAAPDALEPATVEEVGGLTVVRPGAGPLEVPPGEGPLLLDLTDLPDHPDLPDTLRAATEQVLAAPLLDLILVRVLSGMPDDTGDRAAIFVQQRAYAERPPWPGSAAARPLVVRIDDHPPPPVAALAGTLRAEGRAWLVGAHLPAELAEIRALPVADGGLAVRWGMRYTEAGLPWPDVIPADAADVDGLADPSDAPPPVPTTRERSEVVRYVTGTASEIGDGPEVQRAALLVAHGALRRFYGETGHVADDFDARLLELLERPSLDGLDALPDRRAFADRLWRLADAARDSIAYVEDRVTPVVEFAPVFMDHERDGRPVIVRASTPDLEPGDVITHIEGVEREAWYADALTRAGGASLGASWIRAAAAFVRGDGPLSLTVQRPDGSAADVVVERGPADAYPSQSAWRHPNGPLDAFDAPEVLYLDPTGRSADESQLALISFVAGQAEAEALIVDLRGLLGVNPYRVAEAIFGAERHPSPQFVIGAWVGPDAQAWTTDQYPIGGTGEASFAGPIVLLTSPMTIYSSETVAIMVSVLEQVTVIGRQSAASLADQTATFVPGGFTVGFAGYSTRFPNGGPHFEIGVVPDIPVWPTAQSIADGVDLELEAALEFLRGAVQP